MKTSPFNCHDQPSAKVLTPAQVKRRAAYARLVASLAVPQRTTLAHFPKHKQQGAGSAFKTA